MFCLFKQDWHCFLIMFTDVFFVWCQKCSPDSSNTFLPSQFCLCVFICIYMLHRKQCCLCLHWIHTIILNPPLAPDLSSLSEHYSGWFRHWGGKWEHVTIATPPQPQPFGWYRERRVVQANVHSGSLTPSSSCSSQWSGLEETAFVGCHEPFLHCFLERSLSCSRKWVLLILLLLLFCIFFFFNDFYSF